MAKKTEKYKQFEIEWITLPSIPWGVMEWNFITGESGVF
jgi:hypothetical protein